MINKIIAVFIMLSLICGSGLFLFAENITLSSGATIQGAPIEIPPEGALYKEAASKIRNIPNGFNPKEVIKNGWQENRELDNVLNDNKEAIELFKKATMQKSEGFIFGKKPLVLNATAEMPNYSGTIKLFKLLLLEARRYEFNKQYKEAASDYLAALGFMQHLSQQKFGIMMATVVNTMNINSIYPCLKDALKNNIFSKSEYQLLLDNLLSINNKQDFLEAALKEEKEDGVGTLRMMEAEAKKGATFQQLFSLGNESAANYKKYASKLNPMLDSEFFKEFYGQLEAKEDIVFNYVITAAKSNKVEACKKELAGFIDSLGSVQALEDNAFTLLEKNANDKDLKLKIADIEAKIFLIIGTPQFTKVITRYHVFYNKLNVLSVALAVKLYQLDNKALPENLNQLVPKYLKAIPPDTFNDFQPLAYKKSGNDFSILSIGAPKFEGDEKVPYDKGSIVFSSK